MAASRSDWTKTSVAGPKRSIRDIFNDSYAAQQFSLLGIAGYFVCANLRESQCIAKWVNYQHFRISPWPLLWLVLQRNLIGLALLVPRVYVIDVNVDFGTLMATSMLRQC